MGFENNLFGPFDIFQSAVPVGVVTLVCTICFSLGLTLCSRLLCYRSEQKHGSEIVVNIRNLVSTICILHVQLPQPYKYVFLSFHYI